MISSKPSKVINPKATGDDSKLWTQLRDLTAVQGEVCCPACCTMPGSLERMPAPGPERELSEARGPCLSHHFGTSTDDGGCDAVSVLSRLRDVMPTHVQQRSQSRQPNVSLQTTPGLSIGPSHGVHFDGWYEIEKAVESWLSRRAYQR